MRITEMQNGAHAYVDTHRQKRRWLVLLACMAAVVALCTMCALMTPASTLEADESEGAATSGSLSYEGDSYSVTVSYDEDAGLPEGTELAVSEYDTDSDVYQTLYEQAAELVELSDDVQLLNISLLSGDEEIEPSASVEVTVTYQDVDVEDLEDSDDLQMVYFASEDAEAEAIDAELTVDEDNNTATITFTADSSGIVVLAPGGGNQGGGNQGGGQQGGGQQGGGQQGGGQQGGGQQGGQGSTSTSGTFDHIEIEVNTTASLVVNGETLTSNVTVNESDVFTITATYNGSSITLSAGGSGQLGGQTISYSGNTEGDGSNDDDTVELTGNYWTGTKDNPVYYTITFTKEVTFTDSNGETYTVNVTLSVTTNYWDSINDCPGLGNSSGNNSWSSGYYISGSGIDVPATGSSELDEGTIQLTKVIEGLTLAEGESKEYSFTIYDEDGDVYDTVTITITGSATQAIAFETRVPAGSYSIVEDTSSAAIDGYVLTSTTYSPTSSTNTNCATVTVTAGGQAAATVTNTYTKNVETGDLTITKEVSGATVNSKEYSFTISTTEDMSEASPKIGDTDVAFSLSTSGDQTIYTATVTVSATSVENSEDGSITITGLPLGSYTVTENTTGEGVNIDITGYRFDSVTYGDSSSNESATVTLSTDSATATVAVTNNYTQVADITVTKVDVQDANTKLSGAVFYLTKTDENGSTLYYSYDATNGVDWVASMNDATELTSGSDGTFTIYGLENGSYSLVEVTAPDGYQLPSSDFNFTVSDGKVNYVSSGIASQSNTITVTNTTGAELPATGGTGTTYLTISGLLLVAIAVGGGFATKRLRKSGTTFDR